MKFDHPARVGLPAAVCVLVDDVAANLPAADVGMATIHHVDSSTTVKALEKALALTPVAPPAHIGRT